jgi:hypothetical protein
MEEPMLLREIDAEWKMDLDLTGSHSGKLRPERRHQTLRAEALADGSFEIRIGGGRRRHGLP